MVFAGLARVFTVLGVGMLGTGCVSTVDGTAARTSPRAGTTTMPLEQLLPSDEELRATMGNELDQNLPPLAGEIDMLPDGYRSNQEASPIDCIGPTYPGLRVVYEKGPVREVAVQNYWNYDLDVMVSDASAAVVRLSSAAGAQRLFTSFVAQWQQCAGTTVTMRTLDSSKSQWFSKVTHVEFHAGVLWATLETWDTNQTRPALVERAVGLESDVIADVGVDVYPNVQTGSRATDLVKAMLRKLSGTN